jgi:Ner family transcriptional regulator
MAKKIEVPAGLTNNNRAEWIKYQLKLRDTSCAQIASDHDVSRQAISKALRVCYPKWEKVLAKAIGVRHEDLFRDRLKKKNFRGRDRAV